MRQKHLQYLALVLIVWLLLWVKIYDSSHHYMLVVNCSRSRSYVIMILSNDDDVHGNIICIIIQKTLIGKSLIPVYHMLIVTKLGNKQGIIFYWRCIITKGPNLAGVC